jgi:hypothetical protein
MIATPRKNIYHKKTTKNNNNNNAELLFLKDTLYDFDCEYLQALTLKLYKTDNDKHIIRIILHTNCFKTSKAIGEHEGIRQNGSRYYKEHERTSVSFVF